MSKNIYKRKECDYCGSLNEIVRPSPFMGDIGAMMCEDCWDRTKEEYMNSNGEYIPSFEDGPGYDDIKSLEEANTVPSSINPNYKMHILTKYECLECERSFILSKKQADDFETIGEDGSSDIRCPYCKSYNVEDVVIMDDPDSLEELGCMAISHVEPEQNEKDDD